MIRERRRRRRRRREEQTGPQQCLKLLDRQGRPAAQADSRERAVPSKTLNCMLPGDRPGKQPAGGLHTLACGSATSLRQTRAVLGKTLNCMIARGGFPRSAGHDLR